MPCAVCGTINCACESSARASSQRIQFSGRHGRSQARIRFQRDRVNASAETMPASGPASGLRSAIALKPSGRKHSGRPTMVTELTSGCIKRARCSTMGDPSQGRRALSRPMRRLFPPARINPAMAWCDGVMRSCCAREKAKCGPGQRPHTKRSQRSSMRLRCRFRPAGCNRHPASFESGLIHPQAQACGFGNR